jgi:predicted Rossmann fold nucleotide-binding protein DprA/Smf involved in DNA uptake
MRGALEAGGHAIGILADSLERAVTNRDNCNHLLAGRLTLVCPYDPSAGFNVGHAMRRNRLIYALADIGLVVSAEVEKGGTWAGATEQLERLRLTTVYVRESDSPGLKALVGKGASVWPMPRTPEAMNQILEHATRGEHEQPQSELVARQEDLFGN